MMPTHLTLEAKHLTLQATVSMSWVNTVLGEAQRQGLAPEVLLAHAGIPLDDIKAERWPIDHITRLWRAAASLTQDAGFGLKAGSQVGPASFNVVSFILQSSPTLRESIAVVQKFQRLISDGGRFQMIAGEQASWVVYHPRQGELAFSPHQLEAVLSAVVSFSRWVTGSGMRPLRAQFSHACAGAARVATRPCSRAPWTLSRPSVACCWTTPRWTSRCPRPTRSWPPCTSRYAAARLAALSDESTSDLATELRVWLATQLGHALPGRAQAAQAFGMSERTLCSAAAGPGAELHRPAGCGAQGARLPGRGPHAARVRRHRPVAGFCRGKRIQPGLQALDGAVAGGIPALQWRRSNTTYLIAMYSINTWAKGLFDAQLLKDSQKTPFWAF
jgi:hypothetical protein